MNWAFRIVAVSTALITLGAASAQNPVMAAQWSPGTIVMFFKPAIRCR